MAVVKSCVLIPSRIEKHKNKPEIYSVSRTLKMQTWSHGIRVFAPKAVRHICIVSRGPGKSVLSVSVLSDVSRSQRKFNLRGIQHFMLHHCFWCFIHLMFPYMWCILKHIWRRTMAWCIISKKLCILCSHLLALTRWHCSVLMYTSINSCHWTICDLSDYPFVQSAPIAST